MNLSVGRLGETKASAYLESFGFRILHRNYRTKVGEIDIVAKRDHIIYFFEVKTRKSVMYGQPYEAVTHFKQIHMKRAAQWYVLQNKLEKSKLKLAVISVLIEGKNETINLYELDSL